MYAWPVLLAGYCYRSNGAVRTSQPTKKTKTVMLSGLTAGDSRSNQSPMSSPLAVALLLPVAIFVPGSSRAEHANPQHYPRK